MEGIIFTINGNQYHIHDSIVNAVIVAIILCVFSIYISCKFKKADYTKKPTGIVLLIEQFYNFIVGIVDQTMGTTRRGFVPYIGSIFLFLLISNLWGLLGFTPPSSDYNFTVTLAILTFILIHFNGIKSKGIGSYLKGYADPNVLFLPLNVIGEIATPISLSFRLFGNILSGVLIMELVHYGLQAISVFLVPASAILHIYFDVFAGVLQAFIFVMLSMAYISQQFSE